MGGRRGERGWNGRRMRRKKKNCPPTRDMRIGVSVRNVWGNGLLNFDVTKEGQGEEVKDIYPGGGGRIRR